MNITITVKGISPLLMHNPRMADPDFEISREISKITGKTKKTEEDRREIERLEWYGGLYAETNGNGVPQVVQPTSKLRKCIIDAARNYKLGKKVEQALLFDGLYVPLAYDGPRDIDKLWESQLYISRLSVGIGTGGSKKRIMRVRPQFFPWGMAVSGIFLPEVMDPSDIKRCVEVAGRAIGIGDNRVNGYGRFTAEVSLHD